VPVPAPLPVPARRPRAFARGHAASVAAPSKRERLSAALDLDRCAPAARRRATFERGRTPLPIWDRADSGPLLRPAIRGHLAR